MSGKLVYRDANLHQYPDVIKAEERGSHVCLGDLHCNALKLIYTLIEEGFLETSKEKYDVLIYIYNKLPEELTPDDLIVFREIIASAKVNRGRSLTLLGDELADRGQNDYFTLLVFEKLHKEGLDFDIMPSNHGVEFIRDYERKYFTGINTLQEGQAQSLTNMLFLIDQGLIKEDSLRLLIKSYYLPHIKPIGYTISAEGEMTLFTHAPVGLETIEALAHRFGIRYDDSTQRNLINTINIINERIQRLLSTKSFSAQVKKINDPYERNPYVLSNPLYRLVWNRVVGDELKTTPKSKKYKINFVHGHIGDKHLELDGQKLKSHQNLDKRFGRPSSPRTTHTIYHCTRHSDDHTASQLVENDMLLGEIEQRQKASEAQYQKNKERFEFTERETSPLRHILNGFITDKLGKDEFNPLVLIATQLLNNLKKINHTYISTDQNELEYNEAVAQLTQSVTLFEKQVKRLHQFTQAISELEKQYIKIKYKAEKKPKDYVTVVSAFQTLLDKLRACRASHFKEDGISEDAFVNQCLDAVNEAEPILKNYRGTWYNINSSAREGLGIIALLPTFLPVIFNKSFREKYSSTFFRAAPPTGSFKVLEKFKTEVLKLKDEPPLEHAPETL